MMDSPKKIEIPEHWFINTGVTTYWPHKEGIWVSKETEPVLRLAAVYHTLMDFPEAKIQLELCNDKFVNDCAGELLSLFNPVVADAKAGKNSRAFQLPGADSKKAIEIYQQWVDTWALGSEMMLGWVVGLNAFQIVFGMLPLNRENYRQLKGRLIQIGNQQSQSWVWKYLLSGEYRRLDQTKRALARRTIQSRGFHNQRERVLLTHAGYWIAIRVLKVKPKELLDMLSSRSSKKDFRLTENDFAARILGPFDEVFNSKQKPGRPGKVVNVSDVGVKMRRKT